MLFERSDRKKIQTTKKQSLLNQKQKIKSTGIERKVKR